ncbi:hypothetical protein NIES2101_36795 [Calothrix sp. HK-06]|nr:hypothetical protein NIES2101_36795 [Calothrix sp. HK-06]
MFDKLNILVLYWQRLSEDYSIFIYHRDTEGTEIREYSEKGENCHSERKAQLFPQARISKMLLLFILITGAVLLVVIIFILFFTGFVDYMPQ